MLLRDLLLGSENSRQKTTGNFVKFERETVYSAVTSRRPHITKSTGALPQNFSSPSEVELPSKINVQYNFSRKIKTIINSSLMSALH